MVACRTWDSYSAASSLGEVARKSFDNVGLEDAFVAMDRKYGFYRASAGARPSFPSNRNKGWY
jgi:hypothetical protein